MPRRNNRKPDKDTKHHHAPFIHDHGSFIHDHGLNPLCRGCAFAGHEPDGRYSRYPGSVCLTSDGRCLKVRPNQTDNNIVKSVSTEVRDAVTK